MLNNKGNDMSNKKKVKVKFNFDTYIPELDTSDKGIDIETKKRYKMPEVSDMNALIKRDQIVSLDEDVAERYLNEEHTLPIGSRSEPVLNVLTKNGYNKSKTGIYIHDDVVKIKFHNKEVELSRAEFIKVLKLYNTDDSSYTITHGFMHKYFQVYSSGALIQMEGLDRFLSPKVLMRAELVA